MKKVYFLLLLLLPIISFSQQQLLIKGIPPNFYVTHNVAANETYASIAKLYNISAIQVAGYNDLTLHDGKIFARTLKVPLANQNFTQKITAGNDLVVPVDYVLSPNESIANVSAKFRLPVSMLKQFNNLTDQQLAGRNQLTVGFLKIKPEASSYFTIVKKSTDILKPDNTRPTNPINKPVPSAADELKVPNGVRVPKKRGDEPVVETKPEVIRQDTIAVGQTNQDSRLPAAAAARSKRVKVFIDCSNTWCDNTFFRTEINIVDFLRDRVASDVHLLITSQRNGNGGSQFQMIFYGQNKFKNLLDTLRFNLDPNATAVERRDAMLKYIKFGLTPFIAKTDYANEINIQMKNSEGGKEETSNADTKDKWNYWVFNAGANGNIDLQELVKNFSYDGRVSASRITDKIKINFRANTDRNVIKYYDDSTKENIDNFRSKTYVVSHSLVKSLSKRWSAAYDTYLSNDTFSNNKRRIYFAAGIEYAIFPYKEVNNRFFTISYNINVRKNQYYETTLYGKKEEVLYGHELSANISVKQKWGSINSELEYRSYLHDLKLNRVNLYSNVDVRVTGGLSVFGYVFGGLVHDQVELIGRGASTTDIFLRRRLLASKFNFNSGFGINYRFGSKLNNFVNPRFDN